MRISTDPTDPAYIDDRPRRVWVNDSEVLGWITADEFRRCVVAVDGVKHGSVMIERLLPVGEVAAEPPPVCNTGLVGVFVKIEEPEAMPSFAPAAVVPVKPVPPSKNKRKK